MVKKLAKRAVENIKQQQQKYNYGEHYTTIANRERAASFKNAL